MLTLSSELHFPQHFPNFYNINIWYFRIKRVCPRSIQSCSTSYLDSFSEDGCLFLVIVQYPKNPKPKQQKQNEEKNRGKKKIDRKKRKETVFCSTLVNFIEYGRIVSLWKNLTLKYLISLRFVCFCCFYCCCFCLFCLGVFCVCFFGIFLSTYKISVFNPFNFDIISSSLT